MPLNIFSRPILVAALIAVTSPVTGVAKPLVTPLQQAVAEAASDDEIVASFYRDRHFAPIWMGEGAATRRAAFLMALEGAPNHGLPASRYDIEAVRAEFAAATTAQAMGALEVAMTRRLLRYARDVSQGVLDPSKVDSGIVVDLPDRDWSVFLDRVAGSDPYAALQSVLPSTQMYTRLLREKLRLEEARIAGGWGDAVPGRGTISVGDEGERVVALRDRLIRMGYLRRSAVAAYDGALEAAVRAFQVDHGLTPDGEAGEATLAAINTSLEDRLGQVVVNLERQRWMNKELEPRHILVNLAEQHAYVVDDGKVTFDSVVVIGKETPDRRTPEFSHTMTHMVINPSWYVPRSIATKEYLPALRRGGARHLQVFSSRGRVNPNAIDFSRYTARTFPYSLRQPPGPKNALGKVKFMFPNKYNIYLHDTPAKSLFGRDVRTFSHGCVRVGRPLELAYHLLAAQEADAEGYFKSILRTGSERRVDLEQPIGVHIVYWSAWVTPTGRANYRGDPYGRDRAVLNALRDAGVEVGRGRS
ncbi:L,D-transpeptidase family protein [Jannaschia aquimarina]|uniref:Murein L,D-transpeptidase n=1 Tax=Jannaschia aquimarina TaxID=935700 RepID=A0A0D1CMB7_9RHOB|nr:L,D-transpeptidase family protein [Jannaschia aquimarina]KIT15907.1 murein L,D-transpeptidase [Jannaschia aquimarina]SNS97526.1 Murein L,D-transpeptidase YcbB/YkuD [Jannaschia aquimarina]